VVIAPPGELDEEVVRRMITEHGVTAVFLTTGLFRMLAQESPECFAGIREVWTGGDSVRRRDCAGFSRRAPGAGR